MNAPTNNAAPHAITTELVENIFFDAKDLDGDRREHIIMATVEADWKAARSERTDRCEVNCYLYADGEPAFTVDGYDVRLDEAVKIDLVWCVLAAEAAR
jgi:hypothetical protein